MAFPYQLVDVAGTQVLDTYEQLRQQEQGTVVILGNEQSLQLLEALMAEMAQVSPQALVSQAQAVDPQAWLAQAQLEQDADDEADPREAAAAGVSLDDLMLLDTDDAPAPGNEEAEAAAPDGALPAFNAFSDADGRPYDEVFLAILPTEHSWQVPCYLKFGGWNTCPPAHVHAAFMRYWGERYGAQVACMTHDVIEMTVQHPPTTIADALELAQQQYLYCNDIVDQGTETIHALAETLLNAKVWYFWWD